MKLQLLQIQVQSCGTIDGFNYAYCKLLYLKAMKLLKTDFFDGNGNVFPINNKSVSVFEKRFAEEEKWDIDDEKLLEQARFIASKKVISLKSNSLFPEIIEQINNQIKTSGPSRSNSLTASDIQDVLDYFDKIKEFLAIFE